MVSCDFAFGSRWRTPAGSISLDLELSYTQPCSLHSEACAHRTGPGAGCSGRDDGLLVYGMRRCLHLGEEETKRFIDVLS
jgi:hypothetical protein